jgi:hypothetical protein
MFSILICFQYGHIFDDVLHFNICSLFVESDDGKLLRPVARLRGWGLKSSVYGKGPVPNWIFVEVDHSMR